ncbi:MAG: hypothetical protein ABI626_10735, partial [Sphingomicrobium sp.]
MIARLAALLIAALAPSAALAQPRQKPLFADTAMLRLTITGPIAEVAQTGGVNRPPRDALLTVSGAVPETLPIQLSPRGITRLKRDVCQFSPLRVSFVRAPGRDSLFSGQKQLKLVTHCRATPSFQQYVLLEYAAYRLYNQLTPLSFRARLALIDYVGPDKRPLATRIGFMIEDLGDVATRNAMRRAAVGERVTTSQLSGTDAARVALFEYMISNLDWSMRAAPAGERCCHNARLLAGANPAGNFAPVPYDFDFSGLVNPPYAVTPEGVANVRERRYRGLCAHNSEALAMAGVFRSKHSALLGVLNEVALDEPVRRRAAAYLE